jgi:hypothetical protein
MINNLFSEVGFSDRLVIQEFLKDVAQTKQIDVSIKHDFKGNVNIYTHF